MFDATSSCRGRGDPLVRMMYMWAKQDSRVIVPTSPQTMSKLNSMDVTEDDVYANLYAIRDEIADQLTDVLVPREKAMRWAEQQIIDTGYYELDKWPHWDGEYDEVPRGYAITVLKELDDRLVVEDHRVYLENAGGLPMGEY